MLLNPSRQVVHALGVLSVCAASIFWMSNRAGSGKLLENAADGGTDTARRTTQFSPLGEFVAENASGGCALSRYEVSPTMRINAHECD